MFFPAEGKGDIKIRRCITEYVCQMINKILGSRGISLEMKASVMKGYVISVFRMLDSFLTDEQNPRSNRDLIL